MGRIRVLPEHVISQIAAGEVIQRPGSVIKELIENSLDAGADKLEIELEDSGLRLLRVKDNGHGMGPDDLSLSIERHATSKIRDAKDLFMVKTFGFRGEALASIRAVSRLRITSRTPDSDTGHMLSVEGMDPPKLEPVQATVGTVVEVRDLFFNMPVRKRFLKSLGSEFRYVLEWIIRYAFAYPEKRFVVEKDGQRFLTLPPEDMRERIRVLWGEGAAQGISLIEEGNDHVRLRLYVTSLDRTRIRPDRCLFYVNQRPVRDKNIQKALIDALLFAIPKGLYPECLLFLDMAPDSVDVNIHPSKEELKLHDVSQIYRLIYNAVDRYIKRPIYPTREGLPPVVGGTVNEVAKHYGDFGNYEPKDRPLKLPFFQEERPSSKKVRVLGQAKGLYIICESEEGLYIFDQHAVHERLLYERLLEAYGKNTLRQPLIVPYTFELSPEEYQGLREVLKELESLGFRISPFGGNSMVLEEVPAVLRDIGPQEIIKQLMECIGQVGKRREGLMHSLLARLACHGAIRAGYGLDESQMQQLIEEIFTKEVAKSCPHGRPVYRFISYQELEKEFGRT